MNRSVVLLFAGIEATSAEVVLRKKDRTPALTLLKDILGEPPIDSGVLIVGGLGVGEQAYSSNIASRLPGSLSSNGTDVFFTVPVELSYSVSGNNTISASPANCTAYMCADQTNKQHLNAVAAMFFDELQYHL